MKRRVATEAPEEYQEVGSRKTVAAILAEQFINAALKGERWALEAVIERLEGRPATAERVEQQDSTLADAIDAAQRELLNGLTPTKEDNDADQHNDSHR